MYEVVFLSPFFSSTNEKKKQANIGYDVNNRFVAFKLNFNIFPDVAHSFTHNYSYSSLPSASHYNKIEHVELAHDWFFLFFSRFSLYSV